MSAAYYIIIGVSERPAPNSARWRRPKAPPRGALGEYAESPRSDLRSTASFACWRRPKAIQRPTPDNPHFAAPPDGSPSLSLRVGSCTARATDKRRLPRGSRSAPGSRRLSHIRQITVFSLPCLGVYHWLRTQVTLTPATFRLPHPRPSARLGSEAEARLALHAYVRKRSEVGGGAKVRARGFGVFAEGSPRRSLRTPPTSVILLPLRG